MAPAFFVSQLKAFLPMFQDAASKVTAFPLFGPILFVSFGNSNSSARIRSSFKSGWMN